MYGYTDYHHMIIGQITYDQCFSSGFKHTAAIPVLSRTVIWFVLEMSNAKDVAFTS